MSASVNATMSFTQTDATHYQYTITLSDGAASSTVGTFWFAWVPGKDFLQANPSPSAPAGWVFAVTGAGTATDGRAIQWKASSAASDIQPGGSLQFSFTSTDTPDYVFGTSASAPGTPVLTSFVYSGAPFVGASEQFTVACFAAGTRILTRAGEVAVEDLAVGDRVPALHGGRVARVTWLGHRHVACGDDGAAWPIRIARGAFAPGMPHRDLVLSPDHAVYVDGVLVPVRRLLNGTTIVHAPVDSVVYWHVETDRHDVLVAEGLPCESYLDTGNRAGFAVGLPLQFPARDQAARAREAICCAPVVFHDENVAEIRARLRARRKA